MHGIRAQILKQLTLTEKARYSAIKPPKVAGNQFAYHLKELLSDGMIKKEGVLYSLTTKGENFADGISLKTFTIRKQPKIVTMLFIKNNKDEVLFYKRDKQPFIGKISLPYGKIHIGERIEEAGTRELSEKTGLTWDKITYRGDAYIAIYDKEEVVSHMLCHLFEVKLGRNNPRDPKDGCFWIKESEIDFKKLIPGTKEAFSLLKKEKTYFFKEIFVEI